MSVSPMASGRPPSGGGGKLQDTEVQTSPMVSQFWTHSSQDFLKQPLYSRDDPPARP